MLFGLPGDHCSGQCVTNDLKPQTSLPLLVSVKGVLIVFSQEVLVLVNIEENICLLSPFCDLNIKVFVHSESWSGVQ